MLSLTELAVSGYRSLRRIRLPVERLSVFVGANGTGKTNLYRALQLVQSAAAGTLSQSLAAEGGFDSVFWAGLRQKGEPVRVKLEVRLTHPNMGDLIYHVETGLRPPTGAGFELEPQIKAETLVRTSGRQPVTLLERKGPTACILGERGTMRPIGTELLETEVALAAFQDAEALPELHFVRQTLASWRFFHDFRTDSASPLRAPCLAVTSPMLTSDGSNLAAVLATLAFIREDTSDLDAVIDTAFPGTRLHIAPPSRTASFGVIFPEYPQRVFEAAELSDGTLRFLALAGALLSYRLPPFIALNEPEASLHPDLLDPLADLVVRASERTQIWLVTHSEILAEAISRRSAIEPRRVVKRKGETWIDGLRLSGDFRDD